VENGSTFAMKAEVCLKGRLGNGLPVEIRGCGTLLPGGGRERRVGGSGEVLLLDLWGTRTSTTVLVDGLLSLGSGLLSVALDGLGGVAGVLVSQTLDLSSLLAGDLTALLELAIDDLLVLDVDERGKVGDEGGDQGQAPERDELDEEVGDQGSEEGLQTKC
jgi:hypothetical protein